MYAPENLSDQARAAIIDPANDVYLSVASAWELWLKHAMKPIVALAAVLNGGGASFLNACNESGIVLLDIRLQHAATAAALPRVHRDPFDRMLIPQAMVEGLTAVTDDPAFRRSKRLCVLAPKRVRSTAKQRSARMRRSLRDHRVLLPQPPAIPKSRPGNGNRARAISSACSVRERQTAVIFCRQP